MTAARLTAVVVFPTPPFWFATAIDLVIGMFGAKPNTLQPRQATKDVSRVPPTRMGHVKHSYTKAQRRSPGKGKPFFIQTFVGRREKPAELKGRRELGPGAGGLRRTSAVAPGR